MAQLDSSIFFQQQPNDYVGAIDRGLSLGDRFRGIQKQKNLNDAYAESMQINPDGSRTLNKNAFMGNLLKGGYGAEAGQLQQQWAKEAQAQKQQDIENQLKERHYKILEQQNAIDNSFKNRAFGLDSAKFDFEKQKLLAEAAKKNTPAALGTTDKQRYDNLNMALKGVTGMKSALTAGDNTFTVFGDNDFTANRNRAVEAIGRMQSGGAIGKEEAESFKNLLPTVFDDAEMQQKKLQAIEDEMKSRFQTMGLEPQSQTPTQQTPKAPAHGTIENGYIFYGGDPSDQKNWKRLK